MEKVRLYFVLVKQRLAERIDEIFLNTGLKKVAIRQKKKEPVMMSWKAASTLDESNADVSMNERLYFSANPFGSSVGTYQN